MQPYILSQSGQPLSLKALMQDRADLLCFVPTGMAWFDVMPIAELTPSDKMTVVLYPNHSLLNHHLARLEDMGWTRDKVDALTADMPPHAERDLWDRVSRGKVSLLLMTVGKFQSVKTLSELLRHSKLGAFILEQAHLALPDLWGPQTDLPYDKLADFFKEHWQNRPPLWICSGVLPQQFHAYLMSRFDMRQTHIQTLKTSVATNRMALVKRCITRYQKLRITRDFIRIHFPEPLTLNLIVCATARQVKEIALRLTPLSTVSYHHQMGPDEREACWKHLMLGTEQVVIVEQSMLHELPIHKFPILRLRTLVWEIPWSCEAFLQMVFQAAPAESTRVETLLLYTKEDFLQLQSRTKNPMLDFMPEKTIFQDHLNRMRHFCLNNLLCRQVQIRQWLAPQQFGVPACGLCDACNRQPSSLWMKLFGRVLY